MKRLLRWAWPPLAPKYTPDGASVAACGRCRCLLDARAGLSLLSHLAEDHKLDHNAASATANFMLDRLHAHTKDRRKA